MKNLKIFFLVILIFPTFVFSQAIEIVSFSENPLEVNPLIGNNLTINYKYSSEPNSVGNHIYIGLEILDSTNEFYASVSGITLENQSSGENIKGNVQFFIGSNNQLSANLPSGYYYQVKAVLYKSGGWIENAWAGYWNTPTLVFQDTSNFNFSTNKISKGADISWMTEMESEGYFWKDNNGNTKELLPLLKEYQLDAVRLRVWVNPENSGANGWCNIDDLVKKAELANALNMDIMICIHYSDWWADPGKQNKPAAWSGLSVLELETAVSNHTTEILSALKVKNITPKWVQIGNETSNGMLWDDGKASEGGFANYAKFVNAGSNAVKTFNNTIKTILHLSEGNDNGLFRWNIDGLLNHGLNANKIDIIGMSLYPDADNWKEMTDNAYANMLDLKSRYGKEVIVSEVGFNSNQPSISYQFLVYIIEKTRQAEGLGVFYWEPIAHGDFTSYSKGAWDEDGSPSVAMDAFMDKTTLNVKDFENENNQLFKVYPNPTTNNITVKGLKNKITSIKIYDIKGKKIRSIKTDSITKTIDISNLKTGIYLLKINNMHSVKFFKD
ncbi:Por secretion system C-terminal sorting domain-containing protein [Polaribacter sp. KT25b]|uniref:glycosyl hydrolase 53 family protein n=1 Tax=Polaribacter sp. KT25b TaxID=1855336 RepID=UPI00087C16FB|nr:glycosyl hydrolase 53 family protein [Polaribacter sp. KT25b]SDR67248.1 Por secretion system C-terminal sorting domain-containing protein [Polaribacter sp. KT25b]